MKSLIIDLSGDMDQAIAAAKELFGDWARCINATVTGKSNRRQLILVRIRFQRVFAGRSR